MKCSVRFVIILLLPLVSSMSSVLSDDCENEIFILCYSSRIIRGLMDRLSQSQKPLVIFPGLEIVSTFNANETDNMIDLEDDTLIGRMANYLRYHEINIKLSDFLGTSKLLSYEYISNGVDQNQLVTEARKKDNKNYILAISLMFGKLLAILGIGSIGALAMKALGVASMALLLTGIVGLKNLHQNNEETSHQIQYVSGGPHRRRRRRQTHPPPDLLPLVYRGWKDAHVQ